MMKNEHNFTSIGLLVAQILLAITCFVHLFAFVTYLFHAELSPYLFPASVLTAIGSNFLFAGKLKIDKKYLLIAAFFSFVVLLVSLFGAWFYFDLSWDGQAYHQTAVYDLAGKWNPLFRSLDTPDHVNDSSVLYFPKNSWLFGAAILRLSGIAEMGKAYNFVILFAAIGVVYAFCRSFRVSVRRAILLTLLILLNPVVWSEIAGYLNDGDLYLLLVIYLASIIQWLRNPKPLFISLGVMAAVCLVNVKFTGLVFFLVSSFFILIYILIRKTGRARTFLKFHLLTGIIAVFIIGFNPYVTNMLNRGNPFYPVLGSAAFPKGSDTNEKFETPKNMKGKSLPVRLFYANFSQPGNAPYNKEKDAKLVWPFTTGTELWKAYDFQETRVSGFGPYFGILLVLTLITLPIILISIKAYRLPVLMFLAGLCCCLCLSKHFWWPRFFPVLWIAPLIPLFLLWIGSTADVLIKKVDRKSKMVKIYSWLLAAIIGVNGLIVAFTHMQWETVSSTTLRTQLETLSKEQRPVEVDYGKFKRSVEEKLDHWNIRFTAASLKHSPLKPHKLMSVVKGYPNQVLYLQQ